MACSSSHALSPASLPWERLLFLTILCRNLPLQRLRNPA
jgi:hypothetical protein